MDMKVLLKRLSSVVEPEGTGVTLTLDLAGTGTLPQATRIFLKDEVLGDLHSEARPPRAQSLLRKLARRVTALVESGLQPGSRGLYLVAGRDIWMPLELKVRVRNFITTGPRPFLPPLLAAAARHPRGYVVALGSDGVQVREIHLGEARTLMDFKAPAIADDRQHLRTARSRFSGSSAPGRGGSERDRRQQRESGSVHGQIREAALELRKLPGRDAAEALFFAGPRDLRQEFEHAFGSAWRGRTKYLGAADAGVDERAARELEAQAAERLAVETLEFHEGRSEGGRLALGPNDVLHALWSGRASRVYLDEFDPLPGVVCTGCGVHRPGMERRCPFCEEEVRATSLAQDVVGYALSHKPAVELVFVGSGAGWLSELGGMAALLATRGARRRTPVLK